MWLITVHHISILLNEFSIIYRLPYQIWRFSVKFYAQIMFCIHSKQFRVFEIAKFEFTVYMV